MSEWTNGPWNSHIREMTGADGETRRKCFIEKGGKALAQFANFGDENEANARLCAVAPVASTNGSPLICTVPALASIAVTPLMVPPVTVRLPLWGW